MRVRHLITKNGRHYFQPNHLMVEKGFIACPLGTDEAAAVAYVERQNRAWDAMRLGIDPHAKPLPLPGTVAALIADYRVSPDFLELSPRTQKDYEKWLPAIEESFGEHDVDALTRKPVKVYYTDTCKHRGLYAGYHMMGVFRALLSFGVSEDWLDHNPALDVKVRTPAGRKVRWTPEQISAFIAKADETGHRSVGTAVMMADWAAQRPFDVRTARWPQYDGVGLRFTQAKTDAEIPSLLCSPALKQRLDDTERESVFILVNEDTKRPWAESTFERVFAEIRQAAGLPKTLQFRDFRRTGATDIAESGATDDELRSVTGHKDRDVVARYVPATTTLATNAINKRLRHRGGK